MNNKNFILQQLKWISIYFAISIVISFIIQSADSIIVIIPVVLFLSFYIRRREMRKFGGGVENFSMFNSNKINYYCMVCGTKHDNLMCPKCGSKMKRIG